LRTGVSWRDLPLDFGDWKTPTASSAAEEIAECGRNWSIVCAESRIWVDDDRFHTYFTGYSPPGGQKSEWCSSDLWIWNFAWIPIRKERHIQLDRESVNLNEVNRKTRWLMAQESKLTADLKALQSVTMKALGAMTSIAERLNCCLHNVRFQQCWIAWKCNTNMRKHRFQTSSEMPSPAMETVWTSSQNQFVELCDSDWNSYNEHSPTSHFFDGSVAGPSWKRCLVIASSHPVQCHPMDKHESRKTKLTISLSGRSADRRQSGFNRK
jgi:hypothetical protein